ncbi:hypothetical protein KUV64_01720 [Mameliella alba]|uniref:hypothetical protein n=1 Tax=Mameliella alba TaxID=561184 RepID=UPI001C94E73A|nr:hypothetical protein [Mameliella alba]MBY6117839.1 hypothetical protein [Mameliella alba]
MPQSDWSVPDWRDGAAYGDWAAWSTDRWRWEFCRRCPDIRAEFDALLNDPQCSFVLVDGKGEREHVITDLDSHLPGFMVPSPLAKERYGYLLLPNPRVAEQPEQALRPFRVSDKKDLVDPSIPSVALVRDHLTTAQVELDDTQQAYVDLFFRDSYAVPLKTSQVAIRFDINKPLEPQLKAASETLKGLQKKRQGKLVQTRRHPEKWLSYLRVLDARDAKATWSEITKVFYEQGILERQRDPSGGYRAPEPKAAHQLWKQADALRFNFGF